MLRATWKSLLARKVRLLMSTAAIALGVAFVVGSLVFSSAMSDSFNRLFGASVGDVVVRPAGSTTLNGDPSTRTVPPAWSPGWPGSPGPRAPTATSRRWASSWSARTTRWSVASAPRRTASATPTPPRRTASRA